ncbi:MAG: siderophore-interacting protein [Actinobacteria bacterium]|nr:siderophore-interacting protein [Actinomycetota bacterium]
MTTSQAARPFVLCETEVVHVERLSPSFVRVHLAGPELADFGTDGPGYDQRIKLVLPHDGGPLPVLGGGEDWYAEWLALPEAERGHMRTYTVRDVLGSGTDTRVVVDLVTHGTDGHGEAGPGSRWAASATIGSRVVLLGPRRGVAYGGIEFAAPEGAELLLAGDETAVPAIAAVLSQLPVDACGAAFLEVPVAADVQSVVHPEGVRVEWLPRDGRAVGARLHEAVLEHLGAGAATVEVPETEVEPGLWETPTYSSSGEDVGEHREAVGHDLADLYAWIAGESRMVTGLRRALVRDLGLDRRQVAFMGYWREGVSMGA